MSLIERERIIFSIVYTKMDKFTLYLTNNGRSEAETKKQANVIKQLNNIMHDNKNNHNDFEFLLEDKERIRKYMLENLATSSCSFCSISVCKVIYSMSIAQIKKDAVIRFYLDIAAQSQRVTKGRKSYKGLCAEVCYRRAQPLPSYVQQLFLSCSLVSKAFKKNARNCNSKLSFVNSP